MGILARIFRGRQYEVDAPQATINVEVTGSAYSIEELRRALQEGVRQVELRQAGLLPFSKLPEWRPPTPTQADLRSLDLMRRFGWTWNEVQQLPPYLLDWLWRNGPDQPPPTPVPVPA